MIGIETYSLSEEDLDLKKLVAEKVGPIKEHAIYLGISSTGSRKGRGKAFCAYIRSKKFSFKEVLQSRRKVFRYNSIFSSKILEKMVGLEFFESIFSSYQRY